MNASSQPAPPVRTPLSRLRVLIADRDTRTASLVHRVLFSFGFQSIEMATRRDQLFDLLTRKHFDLIITEWQLPTTDGISLTRTIRQTKHHPSLRRDVPVIMLTAQADKDAVLVARDAGVTEFLVKPFSARTLSHRLTQVIDNPRAFVEAPGFTGPCRRRRAEPKDGELAERRRPRSAPAAGEIALLPPNRELRRKIGNVAAGEILTEAIVAGAQEALQQQESQFIDWVADDVRRLQEALGRLGDNPDDAAALLQMTDASYAIKSQAGIFGYDLGTEVGGKLVDYLARGGPLTQERLLVLSKHIETIAIIFHQRIRESHRELGHELLRSLHKLVEKMG